ncbi:unnamed protein product [Thlaspi arvense]|uniref:Uncharacterized protein n=1 Tax=Thlaspi arvense TaxID=13288 RepID=A0AAU9T589_THLAR|nr:unnamed protein product [Thlaspi arvense]
MHRGSMYESDGDDEDDIGEDLDELRRACMVTEANSASTGGGGGVMPDSEDEDEDDLEMLRSIKSQLAPSPDLPPTGLPVHSDLESEEDDLEMLRSIKSQLASSTELPPTGLPVHSDSESEDDLELLRSIKSQLALPMDEKDEDGDLDDTLRCIGRRFSVFSDLEANVMNDSTEKNKEVLASHNEPPSGSNTRGSFRDSEEVEAGQLRENTSTESSFPEAARAFVDAIRKNRSYQRFLRRKLGEIERTIKENEKHQKNVMIVNSFQASCKRVTARALSQRKDPRIELISTRKPGSEGNGPPENPSVANYRMALERYPVSVSRRSWTTKENESLAKGIKQQIQETLILEATERSSDLEGSSDDINTIIESIKNLEITPEMMRQFLPKVKWDQLDIKNRSAAECEARWMSSEDPLINHGPWTAEEDEFIRLTVKNKSLTDWLDIAVSLGTNRTPFQCLARYQRSLNADMLKKEWTPEEDEQLREAVNLLGEKDWQSVANMLKGRTGTQCSNRWKKSLHPTIETKGTWSSEEEKRLKVAVTIFGAQKWCKIAQFVPGRTQSQCRAKWETLDPKIKKRESWTEEEDAKLREATAGLESKLKNFEFDREHGIWSKVASNLPGRTHRQCLKRWESLNPHLVPLKKEAIRLRKENTLGNFVDRESERPDLVVGGLALAEIALEPEPALKKKRKARQKKADAEGESESLCADSERQPKKRRKGSESCSGDVCRQENEAEDNGKEKKQRRKGKSVAGTPNNSSGDVCCQENETQDNGKKEKKQRGKRKSVAGTPNSSSGDVCCQENEIEDNG